MLGLVEDETAEEQYEPHRSQHALSQLPKEGNDQYHQT